MAEISGPALGVLLLFTTTPTDRALRTWNWPVIFGNSLEALQRNAERFITLPLFDERDGSLLRGDHGD